MPAQCILEVVPLTSLLFNTLWRFLNYFKVFFNASIHQLFHTTKKEQTYEKKVTSEILTWHRRILSSSIFCLFSISTLDRSSMITPLLLTLAVNNHSHLRLIIVPKPLELSSQWEFIRSMFPYFKNVWKREENKNIDKECIVFTFIWNGEITKIKEEERTECTVTSSLFPQLISLKSKLKKNYICICFPTVLFSHSHILLAL